MRNGAVVARYHQAFNARAFDVWREVFDEDVELVVDGMRFRGVDAAVGYGLASVSQFPGLYIGSERIVAQRGDVVVSEIDLVHRDPAAGSSQRQGTTCEICRIREGRIVACRSYYMAEAPGGDDAVRVPARAEATRVAEERMALRRVAALVTRGVPPDEVFAAVNHEVSWLVGADTVALLRFEPDDAVTLLAAWSARGAELPIGASRPIDDELRSVRETGRTWRFGPAELPPSGPFVEEARRLGVVAAVGVPIVVGGRTWGAALACSTTEAPFADDAEERIAGFTELAAAAISNAQARAELRGLAAEQAALRRVATLVARQSSPNEVFTAVAEEISRLLDAQATIIARLEPGETMVVVASDGSASDVAPVGTRLPLEGTLMGRVMREGGTARVSDWSTGTAVRRRLANQMGIRCTVAVSIAVEGSVWGAISAGTERDAFAPDTERRMTEFTELAAVAIANAESRSELLASRARVVAASDATRRRIERDLHDGAQQRLVHTVVTLKLIRHALMRGDGDAPALVEEALAHAEGATVELRELVHGILPPVLRQRGLRAAVDTLASRTPLPVQIDVDVPRLAPAVEATAYFVVAEALTNVAKHSGASHATVDARVREGILRIRVRDDGRGGARLDGQGLIGLTDRLATLDGQLRVESLPGRGTAVTADIPLSDAAEARGAAERARTFDLRRGRLRDPAPDGL